MLLLPRPLLLFRLLRRGVLRAEADAVAFLPSRPLLRLLLRRCC